MFASANTYAVHDIDSQVSSSFFMAHEGKRVDEDHRSDYRKGSASGISPFSIVNRRQCFATILAYRDDFLFLHDCFCLAASLVSGGGAIIIYVTAPYFRLGKLKI